MSEVAHSCPTLRDPMDCSLPGFSVHGIFQARVLEWVAISFSIIELNQSSNYQGNWWATTNLFITVFHHLKALNKCLLSPS